MNCLKCELIRAKARALFWFSLGKPALEVARLLSEAYGERYFVDYEKLYRASKLPPYTPHLICEVIIGVDESDER